MAKRTAGATRRLRVLSYGRFDGRGFSRGESAPPGLKLEIESASSREEVLDGLRRGSFHAVLVDADPSAVTTVGLLEEIRGEAPDVAVVLRGGEGGADALETALRAGAVDCIAAGVTAPEELTACILRAVKRHRALHEVRTSLAEAEAGEARFQTIVEQNADGIVIVAEDGAIRFVNPAAEELFRRPADELVGEPFGFPLANGTPAELDIVRRDAPTVVAELRVATIPWEGDTAFLVSLRDITDRKEAEQRARQLAREQETRAQAEESQRFYRFLADASEILDSSLDYGETLRRIASLVVPRLADWCVIDVVEDDGEIHRLGATSGAGGRVDLMAELESAYSTAAGTGQPSSEVLRTGDPVLVEEVEEEWLRAHVVDDRHLEILRGLGVHSVLAVPMLTRNRTMGVMTLVSAVPERRFGERDLQLAAELARRAAVAMENARLYRDAHEANRAKTDFLAVVSHELRTPLNAIMGYVDILLGEITGPINEKQSDNLKRVKFASKHLLQIIEEILSYARMESGRESVNVETIDVAELVRDIITVAEPLARERGLEFIVETPEPGVTANTDARKTRQILLNLLTNATKFTDDGQVRLVAEANEDELVFRVEDTGCGIDEDKLERIFEPFWQIEQPRTRRAGGTGLGLSVAKQLSELLGGGLTVESVPGDGSVFTVRLARHLDRLERRAGSSPTA